MRSQSGSTHSSFPSVGRDLSEPLPPPDVVTSVIQHSVRPGAEASYERWLEKITPIAKRYPGHSGIEFIRPPGGTGTYTIMLRFGSLKDLQQWLASESRRMLVAEAEQFFERGEKIDIKTGLEFWFTPPEPRQKHAAPWKQFLVTLSVVFPLTLVVPWLLRPIFAAFPLLGLPGVSNLLVAISVVGLMTYLIMPRYSRLLEGWLYE